jgi:hypothetical protein
MSRRGFGGRYVLAAVCLGLGGSLTLAGCGGSGATQSAADTASASSQNQLLSYARCMRAHGIQVPDPDPANPGQLNVPKSALDNQTALNAAEQACRQYGGKLISGSNGTQAGNTRAVQLAQCLRQHHIPVADPRPGQSLTLPPGTSTQSAAAAIAACTRGGSGSSTRSGG